MRQRILLTLAVAAGRGNSPTDLAGGWHSAYRHSQALSYLPPGYPAESFYALAARLVKEGLVRREKSGKHNLLRLTTGGMDELTGRYGRMGLADWSWDGVWRLVIYDVPEAQRYLRDKIRGALRALGMGRLARSVYISPLPVETRVREYLAAAGLWDKAVVLATAPSGGIEDGKALVRQGWPIAQLASEYVTALRRWQIVRGLQLPDKRLAGIRAVRSDFLEILGRDPLLPCQLLPADWPMTRIRDALAQE